MTVKKNQTVRLTITDVNNKGFGVARLDGDGRVVFVANAVTGEEISAKIIKVASDYLVARCEEVLVESPYRTAPDCKAFPTCGGCVYRHITYEHELSIKTEYVRHAFRKAKLDLAVAPCEGGEVVGYRNKVECPLTENYEVGFFSARSHKVVPATGCRLENPALTPILASVTAWLKEHKVSLYDEESGKGILRHVYLRIGEVSREVMVALVVNDELLHAHDFADFIVKKHPNVVSVLLNYNREKTNVILGKECEILAGKDHIEDSLCGLKFRLAPLSFYQVNGKMAERLYQKALSLADLTKDDTLADLFCGVGTIGLFMAKEAGVKSLLGVEIIPEAIENAKVNAALNGIENATFICGDANSKELSRADVIVVDPPRKGCGEELLKQIAKLSPKKLVYISCNPDTLARDCAILKPLGYETDIVYPFDLFPRTGHVESVVCLTKKVIYDIFQKKAENVQQMQTK